MIHKHLIIASVRDHGSGRVGTVTLSAEFDEMTADAVIADSVLEALADLPRLAIVLDEGACQKVELVHQREMKVPEIEFDLSTTGTVQLLAELEKRCEILALGATLKSDDQHIVMRTRGGRLPVRGMIEELRHECERATAVASYIAREAQTHTNPQEESDHE